MQRVVQYVFATLEGIKIPSGTSVTIDVNSAWNLPIDVLREHDRCLLRSRGMDKGPQNAAFHRVCDLQEHMNTISI